MDAFAMQVANSLVGNEEDAAVIEMHFPAPEILFLEDVLISLAGAAVMVVASALMVVERVRGAADLVAVSAAAAQADGGDACVAASRIATANQVELRDCRTAGDLLDFVVTVTVAAPAGSLPDRFGYTARSYAGWVVQ